MNEETIFELTPADRCRKERHELINKLNKATKFRTTEDWNELSLAEKVLLDAQIGVMNSYIEILSSRIILMEDREHTEKCEENNKPKVIKITIEEEGE